MDNKNAWWRPAVEIFTKVSGWVVVPIIFALIIGKQLDVYYGTRPWIFLSLAAAGFFISIIGMIRTILKYNQEINLKTDEHTNRNNQ